MYDYCTFRAMSHPTIDALFATFGGATALARRLDVPVSTAHGWKREGRVPSWRWRDIARAAAEDGITLPAALRAGANGGPGLRVKSARPCALLRSRAEG